ncbi:aromatic amino acid aminotransferase II [Scheffersomyces xylosifermentans]|uniref:aromatic amino acid aminotransferase II n=1 Tax=Scheffersomyces xylosifermentans TaxID=1304137 RepID=UPI00315DEB1A
MSEPSITHLISKRAAARKTLHFTDGPTNDPPKGFKAHPNPLPLHWGMPNNGFFPIDSIDVNLVEYPFQKSLSIPVTNASLESLSLTGSSEGGQTVTPPLVGASTKANSIRITRHSDDKKKIIDIASGLQYSPVNGLAPLVQFTRDFIERTHKPAYEDWDTIITGGAGDGLNKAAEILLDPEDVILIEEFTFTPFLLNVEHAGGIPVPVKLDISEGSNGIDLDYLTDLLENWEALKPGLRRPKALYTIATGQNPSGLTQSLEFRKKIYNLAVKYDFAIIEDDPYGYLTLPPYQKPQSYLKLGTFLTVEEYLKNHLTPSYLTIDTTARVIRIETFSKLFAPGLRLGFIVAHKKAIDAISKYAALVTRFPSGTSQLIVNNVIEKKFGGVDGWLQWILKMRVTYAHRRDVLLNAIFESEAYKNKYVDVIDPQAGMFVSFIVNFPEGTDIEEKIGLLVWKFAEFGVGVVPGINMAVEKKFSLDRANFFRLTYAPANTDEEIIEGGKRLTAAVQDFFDKGLEF